MKQLGTYSMLNLLSRPFVCPRAVNHNAKLLQPGFNNSGISGQKAVSVAHELLEVYLKISLEDASPSCLWSRHLWGAVEASTLPFISSWLQEKGGKVRGDLSLAHQHMFLCLPSLALGRDYHHIAATVTVHLRGLCATPAPDWHVRRLFFPTLSSLFMQSKPSLHSTDKTTEGHWRLLLEMLYLCRLLGWLSCMNNKK